MTSQIYEMASDLETRLQARNFPVVVQYGPTRTQHDTWRSALIVIDRDRKQGDTLDVVQGTQRNARRRVARMIGVKAEVFAQSGVAGARPCEHEAECDTIVDGFVGELHRWMTEAKAGVLQLSESRYLEPDEVNESEFGAGVVYRLRFRVGRGVDDRDYEGSALPTGAATSTAATVKVSRDGVNYETVN